MSLTDSSTSVIMHYASRTQHYIICDVYVITSNAQHSNQLPLCDNEIWKTHKTVYNKVQTNVNHYLRRTLKWWQIWSIETKHDRNKLQKELKKKKTMEIGGTYDKKKISKIPWTGYLQEHNYKTKKNWKKDNSGGSS